MGKYGWRNNSLVAKDITLDGSMTIKGDLTFGDASTDTFTATGAASFASTVALAGKVTGTITSSSTSGSTSIESMYVKQTMTGAGGVGGRARFHLDTNVALGGWSNALKAEVTYGETGRTAGLGSAFCAEMTLSAGTTSGTYSVFEGELNLGSDAETGTATSFMYLSVNGDDKATFDTSGYILNLQGLAANSGKVFQENTAAAATHALRILIGTTPYYVMLTSVGA
jgi:cytoskeletal protein CcmA (bactofilin family)